MELNPRQFPEGTKFYHGTHKTFDELRPADQHGGGVEWGGFTNPGKAYVTTNEREAWQWAGAGTSMQEGAPRKVYEVEPYGDIQPDTNLSGPQFEVSGATVSRELPGPRNSQLALLPNERGDTFTTFERIALQHNERSQELDMEQRLDAGYQGAPQDTSLFDDDPEARARLRPGRLPDRAQDPTPHKTDAKRYLEETQRYSAERKDQAATEIQAGMKLRTGGQL